MYIVSAENVTWITDPCCAWWREDLKAEKNGIFPKTRLEN
jgi:hypothetical protein